MSFDIDAYRSTVSPVVTDDIDFAAFARQPLSEDALRCLRYMHDVESHTVCYLRDLLLTAAHKDPRITTFLTMWNYEEYWHGAAIAKILRAHGEAGEADRIGPMRERLGLKDRVLPFGSAVGSTVLGRDFIALHMSWGAVNEWSTQLGYDRLAEREGHPVLTELLGRIARQEARHIAFYTTEARERLAASTKAQKVTRWALAHMWGPVGSGVMPEQETQFLLGWLFGDDDGLRLARRIDRRVAALPGMDGLTIVETALRRRGLTSGPAAPRPRSVGRAAPALVAVP
jgi:hypothetical protein